MICCVPSCPDLVVIGFEVTVMVYRKEEGVDDIVLMDIMKRIGVVVCQYVSLNCL